MVQSIEVLLSTFRKKKFYFNVVFSNELLATRSDSRFCEPFNLFSKHIVYNWIRGQDDSLIWRIARIKVCSLQIENKSINKYESHVCHEDSVRITFTIPAIETVCVNENVQESKWAEKKEKHQHSIQTDTTPNIICAYFDHIQTSFIRDIPFRSICLLI